MPITNSSAVEDLKPLTSLRFVAAMMIVAFHAPLYKFPWDWTAAIPPSFLHGVSFFFILSGFILTHVYSARPRVSYGSFMKARIARLWPVHILTLILLVLFVRPDSITFDGPGFLSKWVVLGFNVLLLHAAVPLLAYAFSWNGVSWSISTEMFFYAAFPFLLQNIERTWHVKLAAAAVIAAGIFLVASALGVPLYGEINELSVMSLTYANPLVRGFEFCLGMAAWVLWNRYVRHAALSAMTWSAIEVAVIGITISWVFYTYPLALAKMHPSGMRLFIERSGSFWLFPVVIVCLASGRGMIGRALSIRPLTFLGEISFAIYMFHQVLMKIFFTWAPIETVSTTTFMAALLVSCSAIHLLVERPGRALLLRTRPSRTGSAVAAS